MLNYALNEEKSKTFVKYYKENDDKIIVHYSKGNIVIDNNDRNKNILNTTMENQIKEYDNNKNNTFKNIIGEFAVFECLTAMGGIAATTVIGGIAGVMLSPTVFFTTAKVFSLGILIPVVYSTIRLVEKFDSRKFSLFLKYKDKINEKREAEPEFIMSNNLNQVRNPKKMKNLCINDINFMKYSDVKKLVRPIKKEKKRIALEKKSTELDDMRYEALGINKSLVKKR